MSIDDFRPSGGRCVRADVTTSNYVSSLPDTSEMLESSGWRQMRSHGRNWSAIIIFISISALSSFLWVSPCHPIPVSIGKEVAIKSNRQWIACIISNRLLMIACAFLWLVWWTWKASFSWKYVIYCYRQSFSVSIPSALIKTRAQFEELTEFFQGTDAIYVEDVWAVRVTVMEAVSRWRI